MSPIVGLTDRTPSFKEIGRLRLGIPKSEMATTKGGPQEISYFRPDFRPDALDAFQTFIATYGDQPTIINIRLPFSQIDRCWDAYYEVYNTSGMLGMSDGERWLYLRNNKTGELLVKDGIPTNATDLPTNGNGMPYKPFDKNTPVYSYKNKKGDDVAVYARPTGRLKILIPQLKRAAYVLVITHSVYNIMRISEQLAGIEAIAKNVNLSLPLVPMVLSRRKELISVTFNGKKSMQEHYLLNIEIDPAWMEAQFKYLDTVLPGYQAILRPALPTSIPVAAEDLSEEEPESGDIPPEQPENPWHGEDEYPEETRVEIPASVPASQPPTNGNGKKSIADRPYMPEVIWEKLQEAAQKITKPASDKQRSLLVMLFEICLAGEGAELKRHAVQMYLYGVESMKDVPDNLILASLNTWMKPVQDSGGDYAPDPMAAREVVLVYDAALREQGQMDMPLDEEAT